MSSEKRLKETEIGRIPENWGLRPLTDLVSHVVDNRGRSAPTSETGIPLIATNCIKEDALYPTKEKIRYVSEETYKKWFRDHPKPGDIIIVNKGTPGLVCLVPDPVDFCIAQDMIAIRPNRNLIYDRYLFAFLRSSNFKHQVDSLNVGTTVPHLKKTVFTKLLVPIPPREEQAPIGDTYYWLCSKIELDREMNKTLEAVSRAFFQHWFVDFEFPNEEGKPYKSSGGEMIYSELLKAGIPKGWRFCLLLEVADVIDCLHTKKPSQVVDGQIILQFYNIGTHGLLDLSKVYNVSRDDYEVWTRNILVRGGDCIVTNAGVAGAVAQIPYDFAAGIGRNITAIRPRRIPPTYLLAYLFSTYGRDEIRQNLDLGTIFDSLNVRGIRKLHIVVPDERTLTGFESLARPMREMMEKNAYESMSLSATRDSLLPKLMSGEIRVINPK